MLLSPAGGGLAAVLRGLDGRRAQRSVLADAARAGLDPAAVTRVLDGLRAPGWSSTWRPPICWPRTRARPRPPAPPPSCPGPGPRTGHAPAVPGGSRWRARRSATVVIDGATRVGAPLAAVLAASGVGRVSVRDSGLTTAGDVVVGGLTAADEGRPRSLAAADAVRRVSPLTDLRPRTPEGRADLVVLARAWAGSDPLVAAVHRSGVPHLVATVRGETGVVGPLVVPGVTSCLRCADLHRRDADPRWPGLAAQLTASEPPPSGATVTCLLTAATAAVQVLAYLDGATSPATVDATLEVRPPDLVPRVRRWRAHPACDCGAVSADGGPDSSPGAFPRPAVARSGRVHPRQGE